MYETLNLLSPILMWQFLKTKVPQFRQLDASFSSQRTGFNTRVVYIRNLVDTVILGQIFLQEFFPHQLSFYYCSIFIYNLPWSFLIILISQKIITSVLSWGFTSELALDWT
jgi:hypothetical protein